jgi:hypothetical protein
VQLLREADRVRWSGAIPAEQLLRSWSERQPYEIILPDGPEFLGPVASAVVRVACHVRNCRLRAAPARWAKYVRSLSLESPHAEGIEMPEILDGNPGGAAQDPIEVSPAILARRIHRALDAWLLQQLDNHLQPFFANNTDPGRRIRLTIAADLRTEMAATWADWHASFSDDAALLNHFLRLMICALDGEDSADAAQVLVGPTKLSAIMRGTAVALAIAAAWQTTTPKSSGPGNLERRRNDDSAWTGHGCAADLINGNDMSLCAGSYMWQTQFVILVVHGAIELGRRAEEPFALTNVDQPALSDSDGAGPVIMSISRDFSHAVLSGLDALRALLADVEARHFETLEKAIEKGGLA